MRSVCRFPRGYYFHPSRFQTTSLTFGRSGGMSREPPQEGRAPLARPSGSGITKARTALRVSLASRRFCSLLKPLVCCAG